GDHVIVDIGMDNSNRRYRLVFDLSDHSTTFHPRLIEECDIYFKRSYFPPEVARLDSRQRDKVRRFGLPFPCRSPYEDQGLKNCIGNYLTTQIAPGRPLKSIRLLRDALFTFHDWSVTPTVSQFAVDPETPLEPTVLFQTRVYAPEGANSSEFQEVN